MDSYFTATNKPLQPFHRFSFRNLRFLKSVDSYAHSGNRIEAQEYEQKTNAEIMKENKDFLDRANKEIKKIKAEQKKTATKDA